MTYRNDGRVISNAYSRIVKMARVAYSIIESRSMVKQAVRFRGKELERINQYQTALLQGVRQEHGFKTDKDAIDYLRGKGRWYDSDYPEDFKPDSRLLDIASGKRGIGQIKWLKKYRPSKPLDATQRARVDRYSNMLINRYMAPYDPSLRDAAADSMMRTVGKMGYRKLNLWYHPEYVAPTSDKRFWDIANGRIDPWAATTDALPRWDRYKGARVK